MQFLKQIAILLLNSNISNTIIRYPLRDIIPDKRSRMRVIDLQSDTAEDYVGEMQIRPLEFYKSLMILASVSDSIDLRSL